MSVLCNEITAMLVKRQNMKIHILAGDFVTAVTDSN